MVERFFLALDYPTADEAIEKGMKAICKIRYIYGRNFLERYGGVKINQNLVTGAIDERLRKFSDETGCQTFADMKIAHGASTGRQIMERLSEFLPFDYVTVSAALGGNILREYVEEAAKHNAKVVAWTVHTKTSPEDAQRIYRRPLPDVIYDLSRISGEAGCDAVVMEAGMLDNQRIRELPIRKLVTGIRIDPSDRGEQSRVSGLVELSKHRSDIAYAVVSSRYLEDPESLKLFFDLLKN